uniref:Protein kinase domain-containing protein n=1 Tax=Quercus lobata TaxID=97700 RepID=A0A7N2MI87_QUELO
MASVHLAILQLTLLWVVEASIVNRLNTNTFPLAKDGCEDRCGNVSIPYPFGTREGCYVNDSFLITCNHTYNPPLAFLKTSHINVTDIWLSGEMRIYAFVANDCYNRTGGRARYNLPWLRSGIFPISNTRNKFMAIGCDTYAVIKGSRGTSYTTGCMSLCDSTRDVVEGSCSGIGCCETAIPRGVMDFNLSVSSYYQHKRVWEFNPCSYAFVAEEGTYNFSKQDLWDLKDQGNKIPMVLNWAIGDQNCSEAKKGLESYACKANSECHDSNNGPGYQCSCSKGYQGNPYLKDGCQDIDECLNSTICVQNCTNLPGTYNCSCQLPGYDGDGKWDGTGCKLIPSPERFPLINRISLGVSISLLVLVLGISWLCWGLKRRKLIKLREKFFKQNGGLLLQQQLSKHNGSIETTQIFTAEELKKATNNYHENRILGQGGQGTVYKGILPDNKIVAIKKSKIIDQSQVEQFINEVSILSQINHRNVVKLLGCCLETEVPLLVYEFVTNGTLFNHIHKTDHSSTLQWQLRLQIAVETAGALSYLHSAASTPIIHRDIKSTNVLLDDNYKAKVSDFGASRLVPLDHTQLTTLVQGTLGYLDPEYFHSSQLTEKSDVYSFGVLLAELLTGMKALSFERPEEERNLAMHFVSSMNESRLFEILDQQMLNEGNVEQLNEVAMLAKRCLKVKGEERPTMKEVAMELEGLKAMTKHPWVKGNTSSEETEYLLQKPYDDCIDGVTGNSACYDSIRKQVSISILDDGR